MTPPDAGRDVAAVLLAGGLARRMGGGDKGLRMLGGRPLLEHVLGRIRPQVATLVLNANGDPARFAAFRVPVAADVVPGFAGPLAGVLTGLEWTLDHAPGCRWVVSVPTDAPLLPLDLVGRLKAAVAAGARLACAVSKGRMHPVVALWPVDLATDLRRALSDQDERKVARFTARYSLTRVEWSAEPVDPFFNANRPEDLDEAERFVSP
jgi:molybdopterin-guanine dinucleotide biosynthesis protein A